MKPAYAVMGIYLPGQTKPQIMSAKGKVILFDTREVAINFAPKLADGRIDFWEADGETVSFAPLDPKGVNRACVLTGYDPFDAPIGLNIQSADGKRVYKIHSEARGREWKHHVMFSHVFFDCGQMAKQADGTMVNLALGEQI